MLRFTNYSDKGLTGLANMGNTCFANTCIQMLSHTYELSNVLNSEGYKEHLKKTPDSKMLEEWDMLRKLMWSQNCIIEPGRFIKTIQRVAAIKGRTIFTGFAQNDVTEFLLFIIDCFHNGISRPVTMNIKGSTKTSTDKLAVIVYDMIKTTYSKEYSEIWNIFYGTHISEIVSTENPNVILSQRPEPFFTISLPLPQGINQPTIYNCFDEYVKGEELVGENAWFNEKTNKKENVIKRIRHWGFPNILCIDFKRFDATNKKKQNLVTFPLEELDLTNYVIGYNKNSYKYELYGVCNHSGNALGGHYTGYIQNANKKWYEFNDTTVTLITNPSIVVSPRAYCLFYRKKSVV
jgi:ubiquitin carboxyl-terminal hydrolase 8